MLDFIILYIPKYIYVYMENKNQKTVKTGVEEPVNRTPINEEGMNSAMVILRDLYDSSLSGMPVAEIRTEINKALRILRRARLGIGGAI